MARNHFERTPAMTEYFLSHGSHATPDEGRCAMEWVAYIAGEPHTDSPVCVSPVLKAFGIALNDRWDDEQRQKLRPYLARCIGTAGDGRDLERSWMATDWLVREFCPAFLDLVPSLAGHAAKIRALPPLVGVADRAARATTCVICGAAPTGRNEYAVCFFADDAMKVVTAIAQVAREAVSP